MLVTVWVGKCKISSMTNKGIDTADGRYMGNLGGSTVVVIPIDDSI